MHLLIDLQACQTTGSRHRGIGRYALSLARAIAEQSAATHELSLLLSDRFPESIAGLRSAFAPWVGNKNIHVMAVPGPCRELDPANFTRLRVAERLRHQLIEHIKPDCVHISSLFEGLSDDAVCTVEPVHGDSVVTAVTLFDLIPYLNADRYLADATTRRWYFRRLQWLKNADLLLAISESSRQEAIGCLGTCPGQVINISSAIDPHFQPVQVPAAQKLTLTTCYGIDQRFVLYTGGIDFRKNIEGLIQAYALLSSVIREGLQLVVVCSIQPDDRDRLQRLARQAGLASNELVLTGYVPETDLVALYNLADLFVFPSLHEGFGLPVLEAMACGTPAIGANRSSIPEVLGLPEALFDPLDPQAIAAAIVRALSDEGHRARLREHGLLQARRFSWPESARLALAAMQQAVQRKRQASPVVSAPLHERERRLKLAYLSPLPPLRSGIADYSANLLPELARYYDIELITDQGPVEGTWLGANFPMRSTAWFSANAGRYQRVLYHMGNSEFHAHMVPLLRAIPGVVMLHDYFVSGLLHYMQSRGLDGPAFSMGLLRSHGYKALLAAQQPDPTDAIMAYPANRPMLDAALGVLVHSQFSVQRAMRDYGHHYSRKMIQLPFAQPPAARHSGRGDAGWQQVRNRLAIPAETFLVCSFGFMGPTKLNLELLQAWHASGLAADPQARLVFVGQAAGSEYGKAITALMDRCDNVSITGFARPQDYADWLDAADVGVQLRAQSRGETSAATFDCLAHQLPLVYNAHGTAAELPQHLGVRLADAFTSPALVEALLRLKAQPDARQKISQQGLEFVLAHHHPAQVAQRYREAIEHFYQHGASAAEQALYADMASLVRSGLGPTLDATDLRNAAAGIVTNRRSAGLPRLVCDVTGQQTAHLRGWVTALLERLPAPWQLECVAATDDGWSTARRQIGRALDLHLDLPEEAVIDQHDDVWITFQSQHPGGALFPAHAHRSARVLLPSAQCDSSVMATLLEWLVNEGAPPDFLEPWEWVCEASRSA